MLIQSLSDCPEIIAGDDTHLREILHPEKEAVSLRYSLAHAKLSAGSASALHQLRSSEVYYILKGRGRMEIDGESREVKPGDMVYIPPEARQRIAALDEEDIEFLCIVDPPWQEEDEVILD
jgi:mannose-6-phosphate isomerase-like protein (cupin superfamily)